MSRGFGFGRAFLTGSPLLLVAARLVLGPASGWAGATDAGREAGAGAEGAARGAWEEGATRDVEVASGPVAAVSGLAEPAADDDDDDETDAFLRLKLGRGTLPLALSGTGASRPVPAADEPVWIDELPSCRARPATAPMPPADASRTDDRVVSYEVSIVLVLSASHEPRAVIAPPPAWTGWVGEKDLMVEVERSAASPSPLAAAGCGATARGERDTSQYRSSTKAEEER